MGMTEKTNRFTKAEAEAIKFIQEEFLHMPTFLDEYFDNKKILKAWEKMVKEVKNEVS